jgi:hippurate hydrolase
VSESTPAVYNDPALAERLAVVLKKELGADNVLKADPVMGGEDFSHFGRDGVPAFYFWLGAVDAERLARYTRDGGKPPSLHSAGFYPEPEQTLRTGVRAMSQAVLELLGKP